MNLILPVLLPLAAIPFLIAAGERHPNRREALSLATGALLFLHLLRLAPGVFRGGRPEIHLLEFLPGIAFGFRLEPLGMLFALVASLLWIATTLYAIGYMRGHHEPHQTRFYTCFAIAIAATMGAALAGNLLTLFLFYELLTFSTVPLVTHHGTDAAKRGGRTYLGILLGTSVAFFLPAILLTWHFTGTLDFTDGGILRGTAERPMLMLLLALFAFGIGKAALMPFHRWLPAAMVAPTPVSALLHAVAVVKVGVFSLLKVIVYIFGIDLLCDLSLSDWLAYVAGFTLIAASLVALFQDNLKRRLAYSTVSQLSYIVLGGALANAAGVLGAGMHIAMHAFGKITLFFCAGAIYVAAHKTRVSELNGLGRRMPFTFAAFALAALSIIGLPPGGGLWSKLLLALGAADSGHTLLLAALMVSSLLNVAYLLPVPIRAFLAAPPEEDADDEAAAHTHGEAPLPSVIALCFTAACTVLLFLMPTPLYRALQGMVLTGGAP